MQKHKLELNSILLEVVATISFHKVVNRLLVTVAYNPILSCKSLSVEVGHLHADIIINIRALCSFF